MDLFPFCVSECKWKRIRIWKIWELTTTARNITLLMTFIWPKHNRNRLLRVFNTLDVSHNWLLIIQDQLVLQIRENYNIKQQSSVTSTQFTELITIQSCNDTKWKKMNLKTTQCGMKTAALIPVQQTPSRYKTRS